MGEELVWQHHSSWPQNTPYQTWNTDQFDGNPLVAALYFIERKCEALFGTSETLQKSEVVRLHRYKSPDVGRNIWVTGFSATHRRRTGNAKNDKTAGYTVRIDWDPDKGYHVNVDLTLKTYNEERRFKRAYLIMKWHHQGTPWERYQCDAPTPLFWSVIDRMTLDCEFNKSHPDATGPGDNRYCLERADQLRRMWAQRMSGY